MKKEMSKSVSQLLLLLLHVLYMNFAYKQTYYYNLQVYMHGRDYVKLIYMKHEFTTIAWEYLKITLVSAISPIACVNQVKSTQL